MKDFYRQFWITIETREKLEYFIWITQKNSLMKCFGSIINLERGKQKKLKGKKTIF